MLGLRKRLGFARSGGLGALVARGRHLGPTPNTPSVAVFMCILRFQVEDETEIHEAERELDEVDDALDHNKRKNYIRSKHLSVGTRLNKMLSKYRMKLDFRCNGT